MIKDIEKLVETIYYLPYTKEAIKIIEKSLETLTKYVEKNHFLKTQTYLKEIKIIRNDSKEISNRESAEDRLLQKKLQRSIANLARTILEDTKKIFIVHGRNISMRDKVATIIGILKLDYAHFEMGNDAGLVTIIDKFINNAEDCRYAIVLFSADDIGKLNKIGEQYMSRTRQNVILELGYFLSKVGRKNIIILYEIGKEIEKPSDFDGILFVPFDDHGAWQWKIIKQMKNAKIYVDPVLEGKVK